MPVWVMALQCAETWGLPPWVIASAKLSDDVFLWYQRQGEWEKAKGMRQTHG